MQKHSMSQAAKPARPDPCWSVPNGIKTEAVVIGHSHAAALVSAAKLSRDRPFDIRNLHLDPAWKECGHDPARYLAATDPALPFFAPIGGNYHNVFGLIEHPEPFDFVPPGSSDDSIEPGRRIVPYAILKANFSRHARKQALALMGRFMATRTGPKYHVLPPPPLSDNDYIRIHAGAFFADVLHRGVAPPALRLKLYKLFCEVSRDFCSEIGVPVLDPPSLAVDAQGFLRKDYWRNDATHGNAAYGQLVLDDIARLCEESTDASL